MDNKFSWIISRAQYLSVRVYLENELEGVWLALHSDDIQDYYVRKANDIDALIAHANAHNLI